MSTQTSSLKNRNHVTHGRLAPRARMPEQEAPPEFKLLIYHAYEPEKPAEAGPVGTADNLDGDLLPRDMRHDPAESLTDIAAPVSSPTLERWLQNDPCGYEDGMNREVIASDNPINRADPSGLDVLLTGDSQDQDKVRAVIALARKTLTGEAKKILDEIDDPHSGTCFINLVGSSNTVVVGQFDDGHGADAIDMSDLAKFPEGLGKGMMTQETVLIHELVEQWQKQIHGVTDFHKAHAEAVRIESLAAGANRVGELNTGNLYNGTQTITWAKSITGSDGVSRTQTARQVITIANGNVTSVSVINWGPTTAPATQPTTQSGGG